MEDEVKRPEEEDDGFVELEDDEGNKLRFQYLETVFCGGKVYDLLLPADDEDGGVVILEVIDPESENPSYEPVTDDETGERVFAQFRKEFGGKYEFDGED
jgi:hypothetical protein